MNVQLMIFYGGGNITLEPWYNIFMKIPTKRFDKSLSLPSYEKGAAGFDFVCKNDAIIKPREIKALPANIALDIPEGYVLLVIPRSSTANKLGLMMPHSLGVIDPFYDGDNNEIILLFYNFTNKTVKIKRGDKIAQGIVVKYERVEFDESKKLHPSTINKWKAPKRRLN
jgi:dUTP pyrophosphatase